MLDLVGVAEVRRLLGVSRQRVHQLIRDDPEFPAPVAELASGRIWLRKDIDAWVARRGKPRTDEDGG